MNPFDLQYHNLVMDILLLGMWDKDQLVRTRWADGSPAFTKSLISRQFTFDGKEVPILTSKKVAWKTAIKEMLWIWQYKSNNVKVLQDMGVRIWNEWEIKSGKWKGTIGPALTH